MSETLAGDCEFPELVWVFGQNSFLSSSAHRRRITLELQLPRGQWIHDRLTA